MLKNYQILNLISEGGMGKVFLARHITLDREVAIKKLHSELTANPDFQLRFVNEAKILAKLNHSNIISIFDFIEENSEYYIVMEYVSGLTLDEFLKKNVIPIEESRALKIFDKILSAFGFAHEQGIVHRDIKPSNIIVNQNDEPKILDFGIAKLMQSNHSLTKTGTKMGSLYYMSPEQVLGKDIDYRTDIYSLGVLLFEILTCKLPYNIKSDTEYEIMDCILKQDILEFNITSNKFNNILQKACAKNPNDRFQTITEFSEAINKINTLRDNKLQPEYCLPDKTIISKNTDYDLQNSANASKIKNSGKNIFYLLSGIVIIVIFFILTYLMNQNRESTPVISNQPQIPQQLENPCLKIEIDGKYSGTIKDGTKWEVEIYGFNGTNFKGINTIYWGFSKNTNGMTAPFKGEYDKNNCQIIMYEDPEVNKSGKFVGKISLDGKSITGDWFRYSDNGSYSFNLSRK
ncbi:MAG: serine/threonine-protein kinase [Ignavibacteriae bacterium]|nr:serine/threonine-protein kinase [Ignavibacteriota bacterium]